MKILYVSHMFLPDHAAGTELLTYQVAREMRRRGHEVRVVTCENWFSGLINPWVKDDVYDGIPVHRVHLDARLAPNPMLAQHYLPPVEERLRTLYRTYAPDLIHVHHFLFLTTAVATAARLEGIPVVFTPTDFWLICPTCQLLRYDQSLCNGPTNLAKCAKCVAVGYRRGRYFRRALHRLPEPLFNWGVRHFGSLLGRLSWWGGVLEALAGRAEWNRQVARSLARILVPTQFMRQRFLENGIPADRMTLLPYGLDISWAGMLPPRRFEPPLRIGFIGTVHPHKGLHVLVEAFRLLQATGRAQLEVYGDLGFNPEYTVRLRALAGSDPDIHFQGTFPPEKIGEVLSGLHLLVVPSIWYENTPLVLHSAMAAKLPVVCSEMGGLVEVVRDGVNGLVVPRGNPEALAAALGRCLREPELLPRLSRQMAPVKDTRAYVDELVSIYEEVLR